MQTNDEGEDDLIIAKPPPPAPKNRANKMTFDFGNDEEDEDNGEDSQKVPIENKFFSQTKKNKLTLQEDKDEAPGSSLSTPDLFLDDDDN